jgi:putative endonuclease
VWYVYIVTCADGTLYTGIAKNVDARIIAHNNKKGAKYTATRLPVILEWSESYPSRSAASKRELAIKKLAREEKVELIGTGQ